MTASVQPRVGSRWFSIGVLAAFALSACSAAPASVAPASVAPASVAPASAAPASVAPASVAPASVAPASGVSDVVKAFVEKYKGLPTFTPPGPSLDVSSLKGKSVFIMNQAPNPFNQSIQVAMSDIATKVGMKVTLYPNQGVVSQWVQGMNAAVTQHPDIIILNAAPDPRFLQPQLAEAKAAGIPVVVDHFYDDSSPNPPDCEGCTGVTALVTAPFNLAGEAAANWIIQDSGGTANTLIVGSADILPSPPTVAVMQKTFTDNCPTCKLTVVNVPVQDWNTKVQGEVQAALVKDPSITYVYVLYDAMVSGAVPAVQTVGKTDTVKVASYNGSPYAMKYIQDHNVVALEIGEDTVGIGYATMDQAFRILLGQPTVAERTPIRIWDATNINESGTPPTIGTGYGNELPAGFLKLWGLQP